MVSNIGSLLTRVPITAMVLAEITHDYHLKREGVVTTFAITIPVIITILQTKYGYPIAVHRKDTLKIIQNNFTCAVPITTTSHAS